MTASSSPGLPPAEPLHSDPSADPIATALWAKVLERWDEMATHQAALAHAVASESLAELAARYRKLTADKDKKDRAEERLQAILSAATVLMLSKKTPKAPAKRFNLLTVVMALITLAVCFEVYRRARGR